jgi:uncharacterized protein (UPF0276 family)
LSDAPFLGVGFGLRTPHSGEVLARAERGALRAGFLEAISENHMVRGGRPRRVPLALREHLPVVLHGVSLNLGGTDPLDEAYLDELDALVRRVEPPWLSDHLCWTGVGGRNLHDLLPLPHTEEALRHAAGRIRRVQERLGRRIAVENVSSYLRFAADGMSEWEFLVGVAEEADCGILLDVNNVYVNAWNHGFDARRYLDAIPAGRVFQIHLAGHSLSGALRIDTHDHPICDEVMALFAHAIRRLGPVSTLVEWDDRLPDLGGLLAETERVRSVLERTLEEGKHGATGRAPRGAAAPARAADPRA